ncbi:anthranilate synthase component I family protein [Nocardioides sp. DS6]|uniref:Anthranilate synthase component I family protein n=1 Tax=Nocardioides eburneus TaxID=3231482 RepID=A0ABV3SYD2_9ACTN
MTWAAGGARGAASAAGAARYAIAAGRRFELADDDVSLTFDAGRREVTRHTDGRSEVVGDDIWDVLRDHLTEGVTAVGYLGYACRTDLPALSGGDVPDAVLLLATGTPSQVVSVSEAYGPRSHSQPPPPVPAWYAAAFAEVQEALHAGDTYETNLTYRLTVDADVDPAEAFARLSAANPAPYAGFLQHDIPGARAWLVGSSPERYARIADGWVETKPIKGTTPRDADPERDEHHARQLRTDPKFRSENLIVTDLLRNDLSIVCEPGTVTVPILMGVESYASVHQLVTTVRGRLRAGIGPLDAVRALFPAGSMTGAPKERTMALIARAEQTPRGAYAGAFGTISADEADLGVVIRSTTTAGDGRWTIGTGGGITVRSDVAEEWAESCWKAERIVGVLSSGRSPV